MRQVFSALTAGCLFSGAAGAADVHGGAAAGAVITPGLLWVLPFVALLLSIAILPLVPKLAHWWEKNWVKLSVALVLGALVGAYYLFRGYGFAGAPAGAHSVLRVLEHAILADYIPFIVLLFSLYVISGGIRLTGDIPAHPGTNSLFLLIGALLASLIGTTGASMLLIRPLLQINSERRHIKHTVIFFIFLVSNIGGSLLPVGDPPLFLGYLRGVPFLWTLHLTPIWAVTTALVLVIYFVFDTVAYRSESPRAIRLDESVRQPIRLTGQRNILLLAGVVCAVALLVPGRALPVVGWTVPDMYLRELVQLTLTGLSLVWTPRQIYKANQFNFSAIGEVACLFIGIFITMQVPIEILKIKGESLGVTQPLAFFWMTGALSSFLDNAPTYVVFFELAGSLHLPPDVPVVHGLATASGGILYLNLLAISAGAVFMGANTYIGNGPNFLVKSIAEHRGVKMPSFFGYMAYSGAILLPVFALVSWLFFS